MATNIYEQEARAKKAAKLCAVFCKAGATAGTLRTLDQDGWQFAADMAGVRTPSGETKALVVSIFEAKDDIAKIRAEAVAR